MHLFKLLIYSWLNFGRWYISWNTAISFWFSTFMQFRFLNDVFMISSVFVSFWSLIYFICNISIFQWIWLRVYQSCWFTQRETFRFIFLYLLLLLVHLFLFYWLHPWVWSYLAIYSFWVVYLHFILDIPVGSKLLIWDLSFISPLLCPIGLKIFCFNFCPIWLSFCFLIGKEWSF